MLHVTLALELDMASATNEASRWQSKFIVALYVDNASLFFRVCLCESLCVVVGWFAVQTFVTSICWFSMCSQMSTVVCVDKAIQLTVYGYDNKWRIHDRASIAIRHRFADDVCLMLLYTVFDTHPKHFSLWTKTHSRSTLVVVASAQFHRK